MPFLPFLCPEKEPNIQRHEPRDCSRHLWDPDKTVFTPLSPHLSSSLEAL